MLDEEALEAVVYLKPGAGHQPRGPSKDFMAITNEKDENIPISLVKQVLIPEILEKYCIHLPKTYKITNRTVPGNMLKSLVKSLSSQLAKPFTLI